MEQSKQPTAGDFYYESHGQGYAQQRRADPRIAALVSQALGMARTVLRWARARMSLKTVTYWQLNLLLPADD